MADLPAFNENGQLVVGPGVVWRYRCLHLPSGRQDEQEAVFTSRMAFLACLAKWNGITPGVWQYWPADYGRAFYSPPAVPALLPDTERLKGALRQVHDTITSNRPRKIDAAVDIIHEALTTTVSAPSQRPESPEDTSREISS